jgi:hypothetical protein
MPYALLISVVAAIAVVAIYFLWARKLPGATTPTETPKAP